MVKAAFYIKYKKFPANRKKQLTLENNRDIFMLAMEVGLFFMPKIK